MRSLASALVLAALGALPAAGAPAAPRRPTAPAGLPELRVLLLIHDPIVKSEGGKRLHDVLHWGDPDKLTEDIVKDLAEVSGGWARYKVAERIARDEYPALEDGYRYTEEAYLKCARSGWKDAHKPERVDYAAIIRTEKLVEKVEAGKIDEVWIYGAPYFGYWESTMVGAGAYFCNSEPVAGVKSKRRFVIMGWNYERGVGEALESYGHRCESILTHAFAGLGDDPGKNDWKRFTLYDKVAPGRAEVGNVHFAPNSDSDYDWGNKRTVKSRADDWLTYPAGKAVPREMDCTEWGNGDIRGHHTWWLDHFPRAEGKTRGRLNNWWLYATRFWDYP